jgi:hypothetical protein
MGFASATHDAQAVALHRRQMRATSDKGHIRARLGQGRAETTANTARPHDRNTHVQPPATMFSVSLRTTPVMSGAKRSFPLESRAPSRYTEKTSAPSPRMSMAFAQHIGTTS